MQFLPILYKLYTGLKIWCKVGSRRPMRIDWLYIVWKGIVEISHNTLAYSSQLHIWSQNLNVKNLIQGFRDIWVVNMRKIRAVAAKTVATAVTAVRMAVADIKK